MAVANKRALSTLDEEVMVNRRVCDELRRTAAVAESGQAGESTNRAYREEQWRRLE